MIEFISCVAVIELITHDIMRKFISNSPVIDLISSYPVRELISRDATE